MSTQRDKKLPSQLTFNLTRHTQSLSDAAVRFDPRDVSACSLIGMARERVCIHSCAFNGPHLHVSTVHINVVQMRDKCYAAQLAHTFQLIVTKSSLAYRYVRYRQVGTKLERGRGSR